MTCSPLGPLIHVLITTLVPISVLFDLGLHMTESQSGHNLMLSTQLSSTAARLTSSCSSKTSSTPMASSSLQTEARLVVKTAFAIK